jgi:hypothetical protein
MADKNLSIASNMESIATIAASIGFIGSDIGSMASTSEAHCKRGKDTQKAISIGRIFIGATW